MECCSGELWTNCPVACIARHGAYPKGLNTMVGIQEFKAWEALQARLAEVKLSSEWDGEARVPNRHARSVFIPCAECDWSKGHYADEAHQTGTERVHPCVPLWMRGQPKSVHPGYLLMMEKYVKCGFVTQFRFLAWVEKTMPTFCVGNGMFGGRWWKTVYRFNVFPCDSRFARAALLLLNPAHNLKNQQKQATTLEELVPYVFEEERKRCCYGHLVTIQACADSRGSWRIGLAAKLIRAMRGNHGWGQLAYVVWCLLIHPFPNLFCKLMMDEMDLQGGRAGLLQSGKTAHVVLSKSIAHHMLKLTCCRVASGRSESSRSGLLDVCSLTSVTYMHFIAGRRWEGDVMEDQRDRMEDKDDAYQAMNADGEYSVEQYYAMSRRYVRTIFSQLSGAHRFRETIDEYWKRRIRVVSKGHATGAHAKAPAAIDRAEFDRRLAATAELLRKLVGSVQTALLLTAIGNGSVYDVEPKAVFVDADRPEWWPRPGRVGLHCYRRDRLPTSSTGMIIYHRMRSDAEVDLRAATRDWRVVGNQLNSAFVLMRELHIRMRKPGWADMEKSDSMRLALESAPAIHASQFQKNEVANGRVLTAVAAMDNEIARYVLDDEDKMLSKTGMTDAGLGPAETMALRWRRCLYMRNLILNRIFVSLCSDYANFQNGHSARLMKMHWEERADVVDIPDSQAGRDWKQASDWVVAALGNCRVMNMRTHEIFNAVSSLLSGFADTNGVNTRANISEILMAIEEAKNIVKEVPLGEDAVEDCNASNLGDDSMLMLRCIVLLAVTLECLRAHGRPMVDLKQSISDRYYDYLRLKHCPAGSYGHLLRKLGTTISEDWEGIANLDIASKMSSIRDQLTTLVRRGANAQGVEKMFKAACSHVLRTADNVANRLGLEEMLWSANAGPRYGLSIHQDVWVDHEIELPMRVLRAPRARLLPGRGAADMAKVIVVDIVSAGLPIGDGVLEQLASHLHDEAMEGSRHQIEMDDPSRTMWAKFIDDMKTRTYTTVPSERFDIEVDGTIRAPRCTIWLGESGVGKSANSGNIIRDGDVSTGGSLNCVTWLVRSLSPLTLLCRQTGGLRRLGALL